MKNLELTLSQIKTIKEFCDEMSIDWKEVVNNIADDIKDFEVDDYRFIDENDIDEIQTEELESEPYILGCFTAWFLADVTGIDEDLIKIIQEAEEFEKLGQMIIDKNLTSDLQDAYRNADGYGHHFNPYDGNEYEMCFTTNYRPTDRMFYVFQIN